MDFCFLRSAYLASWRPTWVGCSQVETVLFRLGAEKGDLMIEIDGYVQWIAVAIDSRPS
jgi:hypothetical protein